jgi:hypothetical protein
MRRMYEFDSVSVSSFEAGDLVGHLSARSADGWDVVAIVPAGSNVVAYLRREQPADDAGDAAADVAGSRADGSVESASSGDTVSATTATPDGSAATTSAAGWGAGGVASSSPSDTTTAGSSSWDSGSGAATRGWSDSQQQQTPTSPPSAAPTPSVPAGWYADPAGRFELRYWDGTAWTEHVSRGGQQSTDPPVA